MMLKFFIEQKKRKIETEFINIVKTHPYKGVSKYFRGVFNYKLRITYDFELLQAERVKTLLILKNYF